MKRSGKLHRNTPLGRRPLTKRGRKVSSFARVYGSKTRVAWINSLPCVWCRVRGYSVNAHVADADQKGVGYKADHTTIVPLCSARYGLLGCHEKFDQWVRPFDNDDARDLVKAQAPVIERLWQRELMAALHTTDPLCATCGASFREVGDQCASCAYQPPAA